MRFGPLEISWQGRKALAPVDSRGGWWPIIRESFTGAWQRNVEVRADTVLAYSAVYACISLIASDIGKLRLRLLERVGEGIWDEVTNSAYTPVLRKPNRYQTRQKFVEQWITSKLAYGNAYALKQRDSRGVVNALYVLHPLRVMPMVAPDGGVYYQVSHDELAGATGENLVVPASEIIHDPMICLFHPLVGVSPIYACGLAATQGLRIQESSAYFFANHSNPSGVLTAPGQIKEETAQRLKTYWEQEYARSNSGRIAVLGDGLKFEPMTMTAADSQLIEQLRWSAETVCSCFHVPPYMIGVGPMPPYNNVEALNQQYYSQCLQALIESLEAHLDDGLSLPDRLGTDLDLEDLLRMDTATKVKATAESIGAGFMSPNEGRRRFNLRPVKGGDTPYLQQQNYSLSALDERDSAGPLLDPGPNPANGSAPPQDEAQDEAARQLAAMLQTFREVRACSTASS